VRGSSGSAGGGAAEVSPSHPVGGDGLHPDAILTLTVWKPVSQSHMLRTWAMAEVVNPRWAPNLAGVQWPATLRAKMDAGQWNALTEDEWLVVEHVLLRLRAPLLDGLLPLQPKWYEGEFAIVVVAEMGFMRFKKKTPASGRLADYAEDERGTQAREPEFIRARMVGVPVAVGPSLEGRLILVEGYTRCCCALRDHNTGLYDGLPMPMVVGVTERIQEWARW